MEKRERKNAALYAASLILLFSACVCLFYLGWRYDNKYTYPAPRAQMGVTVTDMQTHEHKPLFYLVDGWAFYHGLRTPGELAEPGITPDAYLYLGRYGGFDLGDAAAPRHGAGTYKMTVFTGSDETREYALELTQIYSRWNLWINGELRQSVDMEHEGPSPAPQNWLVTFTAGDRIEIVVAVADENGLYSGMVYPPALGSPEAVGRQLSTRLIIHCAVMAAALLLGLLCLLTGASLRFSRPYAGMFFLCLCFAVYTAYPLFQALGLRGAGLTVFERLCYYAVLFFIIRMQGSLSGMPKRIYYPACAAALLVCLLVLLQPLLGFEQAGAYYAFGRVLEIYKWLAAAYLLLSGAGAVAKKRRGSKALLFGFTVFAAALTADRLWPMYEPILLGWPQELAGFVLILIIAALLWRDTAAVYRENLLVTERHKLAEAELSANRRYTALQQEYVRSSERRLHETRNNLLVLRHYALEDERAALMTYLDRLLQDRSISNASYSDNALLDALLHIQLDRAAKLDIYAEHTLSAVPASLPLDDGDLSSVIMNVLDNAIEAAAEAESERWLYFSLSWEAEKRELKIGCGNSKRSIPAGGKGRGHGHGLSIIRDIAQRYGGAAHIREEADSFHIDICLYL